jgi:hypothetical protein
MSQLKAEAMVREFHYNGIRIPDPGPDLRSPRSFSLPFSVVFRLCK